MKKRQTIIFHIDGDAFFASCEQSTQVQLRGKPIVVGRERGVATAFSYEAKELGVTRGMTGKQIIKEFPEVILVSSDYRKYGLFSRRFKKMVRTYTDQVEGMSIDECYADMTDIVNDFPQAERLARIMQHELSVKLGMTFSIGIGPNKTIAKIASGMNKPCGITNISPCDIEGKLYHKSIASVSGIGSQSVRSLNNKRVYTIGDLCQKSMGWIEDNCSKPYKEIYRELQGESIRSLDMVYQKPQSISKIRAFAPASSDSDYLLAEFSRNAEIVAKKMFRENVQGRTLSLGMKLPKIPGKGVMVQSKELFSLSIKLTPERPICHTQDIIDLINQNFKELYIFGHDYRATYVAVHGLKTIDDQLELFMDTKTKTTNCVVAELTHNLEKQYGDSVLHRAVSLGAMHIAKPIDVPEGNDMRGTPSITSREGKKVLEIPYLGVFS